MKNRMSNTCTGKNEGAEQFRAREQGGQERQGLLRKPRRALLSGMEGACRAVMGERGWNRELKSLEKEEASGRRSPMPAGQKEPQLRV